MDATIGMTVDVGGTGVSVGVAVRVATGTPHPTTNDRMHIALIINSNIFLWFILFSFFIRPNPTAQPFALVDNGRTWTLLGNRKTRREESAHKTQLYSLLDGF